MITTTITTKNLGTTIREFIADTVGGTIADSYERNDDAGAIANYVVDLSHVAGITEQGNRLVLDVRTWTQGDSISAEIRTSIATELYENSRLVRNGRSLDVDMMADVEVLRPFDAVPNVTVDHFGLNLSTGQLEQNTIAFHQDVVTLAMRIGQIKF